MTCLRLHSQFAGHLQKVPPVPVVVDVVSDTFYHTKTQTPQTIIARRRTPDGRKADVQSDRIPTTNAEGSGSKCAQKSTNREAVGESTWSNAQERVNTQPSVIPCRFYQQGYCRFGSECWFLHEVPDKLGNKAAITDKDDAPTCSICYEVPTTFGLLVSCDHIFCIDCVRSWRKSRRQSSICSDQTKTCPLCRKKVPYVVPSSRVPRDAQDKVSIIDSYKSAVAKIPCKYFAETKSCPFGDLCLYQHANADGTRYIMGPPKRERRRNNPFEGFEGFEGGPMILDEDFPDFGGLSFFESDVESSAWNVLIDAFESYEYDWEVEDDIEDYRDSDEEAFVYPGEEPEDILTFLPSHMDSNEYDWAPW
ncbi:893_t:CDS:2 [Paraglomus occultum]|uniref:893_t:CDS:1 n=1 Tax=Paraglomus occultum TaxID=144539 RepID=A0A9N9FI81_9GLOM|nr:893_t:CDS:2 [Paraglomus occultum]